MKFISSVVVLLFGAFLVTGCSIDINTSTSKTEEFASKAEEMGYKFMDAEEAIEPLSDKETLTDEDQELVETEVGELLTLIEEFKEDSSSLLGKMTQKIAGKEISKKEKALQDIYEKAQNKEIQSSEIQHLQEILAADFEINLLGD